MSNYAHMVYFFIKKMISKNKYFITTIKNHTTPQIQKFGYEKT